MKKTFIFLILTTVCFACIAQDVIVKKDGKEIEAKIIEVHETEIHYKKFNNQTGPTYIVGVASLIEIRYENGDIELYAAAVIGKKKRPPTSKPKQVKPEEIIVRSGQYYYQGRQISTKKVKQLFAKHNSDEAITMWNKSNMSQGLSYAANIMSYPIVLISYINPFSLIVEPAVAILISVGGYLISAGLQVTYYALKTLYLNQRIEAVELFNEDIKSEQEHGNDDYY